jgi:glycerol uptake facilitator protein
MIPAWALGEFVGTFVLVFFGCGSVATAVLTEARLNGFEVAGIWGFGVALAILLTSSLSGAHLNPAVTIAFAVWKGFPKARVVPYVVMQISGAVAASAVLFILYAGAIRSFEAAHGIVRGQPGSEASAMIFGEYFPNPGGRPLVVDHAPFARQMRSFLLEAAATASLVFVICGLAEERIGKRVGRLKPWAIGLTVAILICLIGPLTMACLNPARDFGPRLFSSFSGWNRVPFRANGLGWLTVYIMAPIGGGILGAGLQHAIRKGHQRMKAQARQSKSSIE